MEEQNNTIKRSSWLIILIIQSVIMFGIIIWAITQKVEAEKQKVLALYEKEQAIKAQQIAEEAKEQARKAIQIAEESKEIGMMTKTETLIAKEEAEKARIMMMACKEDYLKLKEDYQKLLTKKK